MTEDEAFYKLAEVKIKADHDHEVAKARAEVATRYARKMLTPTVHPVPSTNTHFDSTGYTEWLEGQGKWVTGEGMVYVDPLTGLPKKSLIERANEKYDAQMIKADTKKETKWVPEYEERWLKDNQDFNQRLVGKPKWLPNYMEDMNDGIVRSDREIKWLPNYVDGAGIPILLHPVEQEYMYGPGQNPYENTRKAKQEEHYLFGKHYRLIPRWPFIQVTIGHPDIQPVPLWDERDLV